MNEQKMMQAVVVSDDKQRTMRWTAVPRPTIGAEEVLIEVAATAVNRADLLQRMGQYPPPKGVTEVMGLEAAGVIVEAKTSDPRWQPGSRVCCLLAGGGYAHYVACPTAQLLPVPDTLTLQEAAALPEALFTAFLNIYLEGELKEGEHVLVHAGASGVGTAALQICRALGNTVYATASAGKLPLLEQLGAALAIDRQAEDFVERLKEHREGRGVDVILDPVGASYLPRNVAALAPGGRLVVIGLLGGIDGQLPLGLLLRRRLKVIGSVLRARSVEEKRVIRDALLARVWPHVAAGAIKPVIDVTLPVEQVTEAHDMLRRNATSGKVVLALGGA